MIGDYSFELRTTDNNGASTRDTVVIRSSATALPVQWLYFTARSDGKENKLLWATAGETYNRLFEVERSENGVDYITIGKVNGAGISITTQNYSFTDNARNDKKIFYRLKQVSNDGKFSYSQVAIVNGSRQGKHRSFPQPGKKCFNRVDG